MDAAQALRSSSRWGDALVQLRELRARQTPPWRDARGTFGITQGRRGRAARRAARGGRERSLIVERATERGPEPRSLAIARARAREVVAGLAEIARGADAVPDVGISELLRAAHLPRWATERRAARHARIRCSVAPRARLGARIARTGVRLRLREQSFVDVDQAGARAEGTGDDRECTRRTKKGSRVSRHAAPV